jgi:hypothetical protein
VFLLRVRTGLNARLLHTLVGLSCNGIRRRNYRDSPLIAVVFPLRSIHVEIRSSFVKTALDVHVQYDIIPSIHLLCYRSQQPNRLCICHGIR